MTGDDLRIACGIAAVIIGLAGYAPYFYGIYKQRTRPHVFSWFIWGVLTGIAFAIQIKSGAGAGAWITGFTTLACLTIAAVALRHGEKTITRSDWLTFIAAMASIPLWLLTKDPLYSVLLISVIDALGFYPTFRKTWHKPWEETLISHFMNGAKWIFALAALEQISMNTAFYPFTLVFLNFAFVALALWRRQALGSVDNHLSQMRVAAR